MPDDTPVRLRSRDWFDNPERWDMTALYLERFMNYGVTPEELQSGKPIIGIAQSGSDLSPCNRIHLDLAKRVRDGMPSTACANECDALNRLSDGVWIVDLFSEGASEAFAVCVVPLQPHTRITSASTFSMWASFLGQHSTIWFPGQMRQKLINDQAIFEGEVDYEDELSESIIRVLHHD